MSQEELERICNLVEAVKWCWLLFTGHWLLIPTGKALTWVYTDYFSSIFLLLPWTL